MPWWWFVAGISPQLWMRLRSITVPRARPYESLPRMKQIVVWWLVTSLSRNTTPSP